VLGRPAVQLTGSPRRAGRIAIARDRARRCAGAAGAVLPARFGIRPERTPPFLLPVRTGPVESGHDAPGFYGDDADDAPQEPDVSRRSRGVALLLSFFGGVWTASLYVDKPRTAIAMLFTFGGCGIWYLYDSRADWAGEFRDGDDLPLRNWSVAESQFTQHRLVGARSSA